MKPTPSESFDSNHAEVAPDGAAYGVPMIRSQMNGRDWGILLVLALVWGGAFFLIGVAVREVQPITYVWLRLTIAAAGMWLFVRLSGKRFDLPHSAWASILILAVLNNTLPFVLIGWGEMHIASGLAAILNVTTPIWGVVVAHFLTRDERLSPRKLAGVLLGFVGVAVMIGPSLLSEIGSASAAELACVIAALSYALAAVWARRYRAMGISPLGVTTGQLTAGAFVTLPLAMIVDQPWTRPLPTFGAWVAIATLALACTAFAYVLYFRLLETSGATNALLVTLLVPPVAILLGGTLLGETLAPQDFAGLALIALGLGAIDGRLLQILRPARLPKAA